MTKDEWLNNKKKIWEKEDIEMPCKKCGFCPYGQLIEEFPLHLKRTKGITCPIFGHDCPVFYLGEKI